MRPDYATSSVARAVSAPSVEERRQPSKADEDHSADHAEKDDDDDEPTRVMLKPSDVRRSRAAALIPARSRGAHVITGQLRPIRNIRKQNISNLTHKLHNIRRKALQYICGSISYLFFTSSSVASAQSSALSAHVDATVMSCAAMRWFRTLTNAHME